MSGIRYIVAGSFIDGSGGDIRKNIFLEVKNGIIAAMGSASDIPSHADSAIDDLSHCVIVPPLVDCSVSLLQSPSVDTAESASAKSHTLTEKVVMLERHISYCHAHGVLGVANSDDMKAGMDTISLIDIRTAGCDFLKVNYSASIEEEESPSPQFQPEELRNILNQTPDKKSVVLANGEKDVADALAADCDAIEQGYGMGENNLKRMAEENVMWIPSVLRAKNGLDGASSGGSVCCRFSTRYVAPGKPVPGAETFWKEMLAEQLAQLRLAKELEVKTAVGTGAGSLGILHGESMVEEMKLFMRAGYSLEETIQIASENGALFFGMEKLGALTVGKPATFLVARGTVKQLPRKLAYLEGIYFNGALSSSYRKNPVKTV